MPRTIFKGRVKRRLAPYRPRKGAMAARRYKLWSPRGNPTFTETCVITPITTGTTGSSTGLLQVAMDSIPQYADYQALYNQYCIRAVTFIVMPEYDQYDSNNSATGSVAAVTAPRFTYAINDSAQQPMPTSELQVLSDNGAKVRTLDRPIKIRCRPVAQVAVTDSNSNPVFESKRNRWLSFNVASTAHVGAAWALTQTVPNSVLSLPACKVYAKITFSLRDPK